MSELQNKYASVITAAQGAGISNLQIQEQEGILYVSGSASNSAAKDAVWNALGVVDPNFTASDINVDVRLQDFLQELIYSKAAKGELVDAGWTNQR
ncbi:hypothetical protein FQR65_LT17595 [Abscondita terminalis]|nr:hypothetical protein FQR65_LT17595 [Abscondita terminalis]